MGDINDTLGISNAPGGLSNSGNEKYPLLRLVAGLLKVFGIFSLILGVICTFSGLSTLLNLLARDAFSYALETSLSSFGFGLACVFSGLITAAVGELANVAMDIEANTRKG